MARMSIDDKVCRDPRITVLAASIGWSRRETVGCLILDVWAVCYDQETHLLSERLIDAAAGFIGFAAAMIECDLAVRDRSGKVRVRGAKERIEYLDHKKRAGRQGGLKSAEVRSKEVKQKPSNGGSTPQARGNPSVPDLPSASAQGERPAAPTRLVTDAFQARYLTAYGSKPTWPPKTTKQVQDLLKSHSADEIAKRIRVLFESPPSWLKPPFDFGTLVQHFDKLVAAPVTRQEPLRVLQDLTRRPA